MSTLQRLADRGLVRPPRWLPAKVQYETIMGSVAYGVSSDTSDVDVYGWAIPPRDNVFPFGIVKFFQLAMENNLQRDNDRLKAIRRGEWTEERLRQWAADKEADLERAYAASPLPAGPDESRIKALLLNCLEEHYGTLADCVVEPDRAVEGAAIGTGGTGPGAGPAVSCKPRRDTMRAPEEDRPMAAIRIRKTLDSDTLHVPELRPYIGRTVEIVVEGVPADRAAAAARLPALLQEIARTRYELAPGTPDSTEMLREDRAR